MRETKRIDGKARAARVTSEVAAAVTAVKTMSGITPGICAVLVGDDPASAIYVRSKGKVRVRKRLVPACVPIEFLPTMGTEPPIYGRQCVAGYSRGERSGARRGFRNVSRMTTMPLRSVKR